MLSALPQNVTWHPTKNGDIDPSKIGPRSEKKYVFYCFDCKHEITDKVSRVTVKKQCQYCSPRWEHCPNDDCDFCFRRSFASNPKSKMWHPTENGDMIPLHTVKNSMTKFIFICDLCNHTFSKSPNQLTTKKTGCPYCLRRNICGIEKCDFCYSSSFASISFSKYWHPTKNKEITPFQITKANDKEFWFQCDKCPHSFKKIISSVTRKGSWCPYCSKSGWRHCKNFDCKWCFNRSFASNPKSKFWHPTKNGELTPLLVAKCTDKICWFKCETCNHDLDMSIELIHTGYWCRYCSSTNWKHCGDKYCKWCFERSFASHSKAKFWNKTKNEKNILEVALHARGDFWFHCDICAHDFELAIYNVTGKNPVWCCYCSSTNWKHCGEETCKWCFNRSFASHEKAKFWHPDNTYNILEVAMFSKKVGKFTCKDCGIVFSSVVAQVSSGNWCGRCKNKTEKKLLMWLENKFPEMTIIHQAKFEWCKLKDYLPFDFYIPELQLIICLDGDQHFKQVQNWKSVGSTQERDIYKMECALQNGCNIIRIYQDDVWRDRQYWNTKLEQKIKGMVERISFIPTNKKMVTEVYNIYKEHCELVLE